MVFDVGASCREALEIAGNAPAPQLRSYSFADAQVDRDSGKRQKECGDTLHQVPHDQMHGTYIDRHDRDRHQEKDRNTGQHHDGL